MAQGRFQGGPSFRAEAHTRLARPKIPSAPSAFPFFGAPQASANKPNLPKGVEAWGDGPLRPEEISSAEAHPVELTRGKTAYRMQPKNWRGKATHTKKRPRASAVTSEFFAAEAFFIWKKGNTTSVAPRK